MSHDAASSVNITLPDGHVRTFSGPVTGRDVAHAIGPGLEKAALAVRIDGKLRDLDREIPGDASLSIVTARDDAALELIRHDAAHVLAMAVQELFPGTQITFGPATDDGFYYDFHREKPFSTADFAAIEQRMEDIIDRDVPIVREVWERDAVARFFEENGERFKAEWVRELPEGEDITMYRQGDWIDLCRGPHLPSTGKLPKAFKLMKLAGAYWRGDAGKPQLQRIYGTAWADAGRLRQHLTMLEEAGKRDHRRIGQEMGLFHLQEEAIGSVFWHPKGWSVYRTIEAYMRRRLDEAGYVEVRTPQLVDRHLWEKSGHWDKFREHMFVAEVDEHDPGVHGHDRDAPSVGANRMLALKPMNCPCHVQIFKNSGIISYRDLPLRMAEFGSCHRYEPSGALHGIMRVRAFTQDDAHIFCTEDQITDETARFCDLLMSVYRNFGFEDVVVKFSDRPAVRAGEDAIWDKAEAALTGATAAAGLETILNPGEGAFYGPKLEFVLRDAIGRDWQCGTLQADFVLPERLDATYIGEDGEKHRPVMLHRAILGSFERFLGILIENFAGRFPFWLAPVQCVVACITNDVNDYANDVATELRRAGLRVETDLRSEKINFKVREHSVAKVPVILVVGGREAENGSVAIRRLGNRNQEILALDEAIARLRAEASQSVA